jgi:hypothetical protein
MLDTHGVFLRHAELRISQDVRIETDRSIRMCDITFRDRFNRVVPHTDPNLHEAESVSIKFRFQKQDLRDDTITQSRSGNRVYCPVVACATIVREMLADKKTSKLLIKVLSLYPTWIVDPDSAPSREQSTNCQSGRRSCFH